MKAKSFPNGWTALVPINDSYTFSFQNSSQFVNISYELEVNELGPYDHLLFKHNFKNEPDFFKTVNNGQENNLENLPTAGANKHGDWYFNEGDDDGKGLFKHLTFCSLIIASPLTINIDDQKSQRWSVTG